MVLKRIKDFFGLNAPELDEVKHEDMIQGTNWMSKRGAGKAKPSVREEKFIEQERETAQTFRGGRPSASMARFGEASTVEEDRDAKRSSTKAVSRLMKSAEKMGSGATTRAKTTPATEGQKRQAQRLTARASKM